MSGRLRELKKRIKSVESTRKITYAMEMVSTAKRKRYQSLMQQAQPYIAGLESLLGRLHQNLPDAPHPFFEERPERKAAVVLMTSDSGLCGSYNHDLIRLAQNFERSQASEKIWIGVGKSGITALKRHAIVLDREVTELRPARFEAILEDLRARLEQLFLGGDVDAVYVIYSHFVTQSQTQGVVEKVLPLGRPQGLSPFGDRPSPAPQGLSLKGTDPKRGPWGDRPSSDYIYEPSPEFVFQKLVPLYFGAKIRQVFMEALVSEQIARMTAMHAATENASEMIDRLVLERNKARQAAITKELIEIVSGSRALK